LLIPSITLLIIFLTYNNCPTLISIITTAPILTLHNLACVLTQFYPEKMNQTYPWKETRNLEAA
jgi:energy-converting hydrogenase Eha subunit E